MSIESRIQKLEEKQTRQLERKAKVRRMDLSMLTDQELEYMLVVHEGGEYDKLELERISAKIEKGQKNGTKRN